MVNYSEPWSASSDYELRELRSVMTWSKTNPYLKYWIEEKISIESLMHLDYFKKGTAVSVGCGYFRELPILLDFSFDKIIGIDKSKSILRDLHHLTNQLKGRAEVRFGVAERLPLENESIESLFIFFNTLGNFDDPEMAIREAFRVLNSSGSLIISVWRDNIYARRLRFSKYKRTPIRTLKIKKTKIFNKIRRKYFICIGNREMHSSIEFDDKEFSKSICSFGFYILQKRLGKYSAVYHFQKI